jgi:hypothetical protein
MRIRGESSNSGSSGASLQKLSAVRSYVSDHEHDAEQHRSAARAAPRPLHRRSPKVRKQSSDSSAGRRTNETALARIRRISSTEWERRKFTALRSTPEGPDFSRAEKSRAEGATTLPLPAFAVVCSSSSQPQNTTEPQIQHLTQPPPPNRAKLEEQNAKQHRSPDLNSLIRRLCTLFDGEGA